MPELLQVLQRLCVGTVVSPRILLFVQRRFGDSDDSGIQRPIATGDALRQTRHLWSTKIAWNLADVEPKPTVPLQRDLVS